MGGGRWMMSDEFESAGVAAPDRSRGPAVTLHRWFLNQPLD